MSKYLVTFKFRTGKKLAIQPENLSIHKGRHSPYNQLHVDGQAIATLEKGSPNYDTNHNILLYNASPLPKLFEFMPDDWDKEEPGIRIIDEIFIRTLKGE
jgi:hypothetical protein